jgi:hypothetical protein
VGVVDQAVQDGVGKRRAADDRVPLFDHVSDNVVKSVVRQGCPLARGRHGTRPGCSSHRPQFAARGCGRCPAGLPCPPRSTGHGPAVEHDDWLEAVLDVVGIE